MKKKKRGKKLIIAAVILAVVIVGGYFGIRFLRMQNISVYVETVSYMNNSWVLSNNATDGTIAEAATQNVYLDLSDRVALNFVTEGQEVKAGDALFMYDTQTLELELEQRRLDVEVAEISLRIAQEQLAQYRKIVPRSIPDVIDITEPEEYQRLEGELLGEPVRPKPEDPETTLWVYEINEQTLLTADEINEWILSGNTVLFTWPDEEDGTVHNDQKFYYYEDEMGVHETLEDGSSAVASSDVGTDPVKDVPEIKDEDQKPNCQPFYWRVDKNTPEVPYGTFYRVAERSIWLPPETGIEIDMSAFEGPTYTAEDKARMIRDQELTIRRLENGLAQARNTVAEAERKITHAVVAASMDGVVKTIADPLSPPQDGTPYCSVVSSTGATVRGFISELDLENTKIGDKLTVRSWMSGAQTDATITEISDYPTDQQQWTNGNPNVSFYEYKAYMDNGGDFEVGEGVSITPYVEDVEAAIVLQNIYVRTESDGSYVMIDDGTGHLKRQDVTVKTTSDPQYLQITSGLDTEDLIAFPYGNGNVVGAKTTTEYQFSIF